MAFSGHDRSNDDLLSPSMPTKYGGANAYDKAFAYGGDTGFRDNSLQGFAVGDPGYQQWHDPSGAERAAARYQGLGMQWANMAPPAIGTDFRQANYYMGQGNQTRGQQAEALGLMRARATGQAPSIARMQGDYALAGALEDQMSAANSARGGPGAQALAARGAMFAGANARGNIAASSEIAAAQERQAAEQAYFGGAGQLRGQDYGAAGMTAGWDTHEADRAAQLAMEQRQLGLQGQLGFEGMGYNVNNAQLQANIAMHGQQLQQWQSQLQADQASDAMANANYWKAAQMGMGGAMGVMGAYAASGGGGQGSLGNAPNMPSGANGYQSNPSPYWSPQDTGGMGGYYGGGR
jgi:hypothetical protein